jgi:ABC-type lipoprotein release transport system permease subunit
MRNAVRATLRSLVRMPGLSLAAGLTLARGIAGSLTLTRLMSGLLFGVGAADPLTFLGVPAVLLLVTLAASYLPARRAARLDPL